MQSFLKTTNISSQFFSKKNKITISFWLNYPKNGNIILGFSIQYPTNRSYVPK